MSGENKYIEFVREYERIKREYNRKKSGGDLKANNVVSRLESEKLYKSEDSVEHMSSNLKKSNLDHKVLKDMKKKLEDIIKDSSLSDVFKRSAIVHDRDLNRVLYNNIRLFIFENGDTLLHLSARHDFAGILKFDYASDLKDERNHDGKLCIELATPNGSFFKGYIERFGGLPGNIHFDSSPSYVSEFKSKASPSGSSERYIQRNNCQSNQEKHFSYRENVHGADRVISEGGDVMCMATHDNANLINRDNTPCEGESTPQFDSKKDGAKDMSMLGSTKQVILKDSYCNDDYNASTRETLYSDKEHFGYKSNSTKKVSLFEDRPSAPDIVFSKNSIETIDNDRKLMKQYVNDVSSKIDGPDQHINHSLGYNVHMSSNNFSRSSEATDFNLVSRLNDNERIIFKENCRDHDYIDFSGNDKELYAERKRDGLESGERMKLSLSQRVDTILTFSKQDEIRRIIEDRSKNNEQKLDEILNTDGLARYINEHFQDIVYEGGNTLLHISALADFGGIFEFNVGKSVIKRKNGDGKRCVELARYDGEFYAGLVKLGFASARKRKSSSSEGDEKSSKSIGSQQPVCKQGQHSDRRRHPHGSYKDRIREIIEDSEMTGEEKWNELFNEKDFYNYVNSNFRDIIYDGGNTLLHLAAKADFTGVFNIANSLTVLHRLNDAGQKCIDLAKDGGEFSQIFRMYDNTEDYQRELEGSR